MTFNQHANIKDSTLKINNLYRFDTTKIKPQDLSEWKAKGNKVGTPANNFGKSNHKPVAIQPDLRKQAMELYLAREKSRVTLHNADYSRDK